VILHYPDTIDTRDLNPGTIVFMICDDGSEHKGEMCLRKAGLEIRDSIRWFHGSPVKHLTVVVGRKPLLGTVVQNVLRYGCGGINVGDCRIGTNGGSCRVGKSDKPTVAGWANMKGHRPSKIDFGRWPANIIHDGGGCVNIFPDSKSGKLEPVDSTNWKSTPFSPKKGWNSHSMDGSKQVAPAGYGDSGSASRFYHTAPSLEALIEYLERLVKT
jgi:hypothetical protein